MFICVAVSKNPVCKQISYLRVSSGRCKKVTAASKGFPARGLGVEFCV